MASNNDENVINVQTLKIKKDDKLNSKVKLSLLPKRILGSKKKPLQASSIIDYSVSSSSIEQDVYSANARPSLKSKQLSLNRIPLHRRSLLTLSQAQNSFRQHGENLRNSTLSSNSLTHKRVHDSVIIQNYTPRFGALRGQPVYINSTTSSDIGSCCFTYKSFVIIVETKPSESHFTVSTNAFDDQNDWQPLVAVYDADSVRQLLHTRVGQLQQLLSDMTNSSASLRVIPNNVNDAAIVKLSLMTPKMYTSQATSITLGTRTKDQSIKFDEFCSLMDNFIVTVDQIHQNLTQYIHSEAK